jgi:hypothetical protein
MLRIGAWGGLVTQVSPYAVPPGGSVAQVNITNLTPGQLTTRGGMEPVSYAPPRAEPSGVITHIFPVSGGLGRSDRLVLIDEHGTLTLSPRVE